MSNGYSLELMRWGGDKEVHLTFWDSEGNVGDQNFVILKTGEVFKMVWNDLTEEHEPKEVNLSYELLNLEKALYEHS